MNLTCPSCGATFLVEPEQLGPTGRRLRCGECRHTWHQEPLGEDQAAEQARAKAVAEPFAPFAPFEAPVEPAPEPAAGSRFEPTAGPAEPEPAEPEPAEPEFGGPARAPTAEPSAAEMEGQVSWRTFSKPAAPQRKPPRSSLAAGWAIYAVVVIGLAAGFYYGRAPLVAKIPQMSRLYDLLGLEDAAVELGLELRDLKTVRRLIDGEPVVVVEGRIVNLSDRDRQVPPLRASVTDAQEVVLESWTFRADSASLAPGGTARFETTARNPPGQGNVLIEIVAGN
jgi:predicted Zn finger-like uncharacterized protein